MDFLDNVPPHPPTPTFDGNTPEHVSPFDENIPLPESIDENVPVQGPSRGEKWKLFLKYF
jgi:hypothetical protein